MTEGKPAPCGWCLTGDHDKCRPVIKYEQRVYTCSCQCRSE